MVMKGSATTALPIPVVVAAVAAIAVTLVYTFLSSNGNNGNEDGGHEDGGHEDDDEGEQRNTSSSNAVVDPVDRGLQLGNGRCDNDNDGGDGGDGGDDENDENDENGNATETTTTTMRRKERTRSESDATPRTANFASTTAVDDDDDNDDNDDNDDDNNESEKEGDARDAPPISTEVGDDADRTTGRMTAPAETTEGREVAARTTPVRTDGPHGTEGGTEGGTGATMEEEDCATDRTGGGIAVVEPAPSESAEAPRRSVSRAETTIASDSLAEEGGVGATGRESVVPPRSERIASKSAAATDAGDDDGAAAVDAAEGAAPVQSVAEPRDTESAIVMATPPSPTTTTGEKHERAAALDLTPKPKKKSKNGLRPELIPTDLREEEGELGFGDVVVAANSPSQQQQQRRRQRRQQSNAPQTLESPNGNDSDRSPRSRSSNVRDLQQNIQTKLNESSYRPRHRSTSTRALQKQIKEDSAENIEPPTEGAEFPSKLSYWKAVEGKNVFVPSRESVSYGGNVKAVSPSSRREKTSVASSGTAGTAAEEMVAAALAEAESLKVRKDNATSANDHGNTEGGGKTVDSGKGQEGNSVSSVSVASSDAMVDAMVKEALLAAQRLQEARARDDDAKEEDIAKIASADGEDGGNDGVALRSMGAEATEGVDGLQTATVAKTDDEENAVVDAHVETSEQTTEDAMGAADIVVEKEEESAVVESTVEVETDQTVEVASEAGVTVDEKEEESAVVESIVEVGTEQTIKISSTKESVIMAQNDVEESAISETIVEVETDQTLEVAVTEVPAIVAKNEEEESVTAASAVEVGTDQTLEVVVTEATDILTDDNGEEVPAQVGIEQPLEIVVEATTVSEENDIDVTDNKEVSSPPPVNAKPPVAQPTSTEPNIESGNIIPEEPKPDNTSTTTAENKKNEDDNVDSLSDSDSQLIVPSASDESSTSSKGSKSSRDYVKIVQTSTGDAMTESEFLSRPIVAEASFAADTMDDAPADTPSDEIPSTKSGGTSDAADETVAEVVMKNDDTQKEGSNVNAPTLDVSCIQEEALAADTTPTNTPANNTSSGNAKKKNRNKNKKKKGKKR